MDIKWKKGLPDLPDERAEIDGKFDLQIQDSREVWKNKQEKHILKKYQLIQ